MFENVEKKLKTLAKFNFICGFVLAGLAFIWVFVTADGNVTGWDFLFAVVLAAVWVLVGFITSLPIYAFAEMVEGIKETNKTLKYIFQDDIRKYQGIEREREEQRQRAEYAQQEAKRLAQKRKEERIAAYWAEHATEKRALLDKKAKAKAMLKQVSGQERDSIQELIRSIDHELAKDR